MKPVPFVPTVAELSAANAGEVAGLEAVISYWAENRCPAEEWFQEVNESWGPAGFVMRRGEEVLGFVVYGLPDHLSRVDRYPVGPLSENAVTLAYVGGDPRTRRHLLVRMLKDLRLRGVVRVEAVASDLGGSRHASTGTLLENGWKASRHGWYRGRPYTLVGTDLGSTVEVGEFARGIIGRVRIPGLKSPAPVPGAFSKAAPAAEPSVRKPVGSRS